MKDCYHGTINVELDVPLFVVAPDHRTKPIHWDDAFPDGEVFDLLRIWFQALRDSTPVNAWLYIPHGSQHRRTPYLHEAIAPKKLEIQDNVRCKITIERDTVRLPYRLFPALVVI